MQFDDSEMQNRVERLRTELRSRKLDALLIDDCEATAYYFNYESSLSFYRAGLIPTEGDAFFVLRSVDVAPLRERTWIKDIVEFPDWIDAHKAVAEKIRRSGLDRARIGIDLRSHALTVRTFEALRHELTNVEFVDVDNLPWKLRKLKSKAELEKLRKSSAVADATMRDVLDAARPGITERDAVRIAVEAYVRHGGDPEWSGVVTAGGGGLGFLHGHLHDKPLRQGDILHVELTPSFENYSSRMIRNVVIGDIPPVLDALSSKMIELQDRQIAAMKPGAIAKDVDRIMRQGALDAGIRDEYPNNTGYTLGYYSNRWIRGSDFTWAFLPNSEWMLEEGMVFHVITSAGGTAISDTVLVGPNGGERLTKMERRLFSSNECAN
ncbi:Xaa-Pro peptidase family protein [Mesorhizobium sp.]|uniref:M24 family metallopeptidase n=1 Tax=Mesorhizobium sp. TaxID=1871066 RepID=UPI001214FCB5|nr:Xaa-Pro peptidase family protein [Mesorhizobium sp.]TIO74083.1 MAG: aminopeptidase P family protein [Mesorhizobium sp.]